MELIGEQRRELWEALLSAFPKRADLEQMTLIDLNLPLEQVSTSGNLRQTVLELIVKVEADGRLVDLITAAYRTVPNNPRLKRIAEEWGIVSSEPAEKETLYHPDRTLPGHTLERRRLDGDAPGNEVNRFHLIPLVSPLTKYDRFFHRLASRLEAWNGKPETLRSTLLAALAHAAGARQAFLAQLKDKSWDIVTGSESAAEERESPLDANVEELLRQAYSYASDPRSKEGNDYPHAILAQLPSQGQRCILVTRMDEGKPPVMLVLYHISGELAPDAALAAVLIRLLEVTANLARVPAAGIEQVEMALYQILHQEFGYVSTAIYNKQYALFEKRVEALTMVFEPTVRIGRNPYIYSWEALTRDPRTQRVPEDLFKIAEEWGSKFLIELDTRLLRKAISSYLQLTQQVETSRLQELSVNVYPASLIRRKYRETVADLEQNSRLPFDKLVLEISEKLPLPPPEPPQRATTEIEWFRSKLEYYRDKQIRFAIDDFGVGYASTSRLSRLAASIVKIDRDALLHMFGQTILEYVIKQSKQVGGDQRVVVEGYDSDIFSTYTLASLYELGVRYVQGHKLGKPGVAIDELSAEIQSEILNDLWNPASRSPAGEQIQ